MRGEHARGALGDARGRKLTAQLGRERGVATLQPHGALALGG